MIKASWGWFGGQPQCSKHFEIVHWDTILASSCSNPRPDVIVNWCMVLMTNLHSWLMTRWQSECPPTSHPLSLRMLKEHASPQKNEFSELALNIFLHLPPTPWPEIGTNKNLVQYHPPPWFLFHYHIYYLFDQDLFTKITLPIFHRVPCCEENRAERDGRYDQVGLDPGTAGRITHFIAYYFFGISGCKFC